MQNPAIVKEICNVPVEISILHNHSSPYDNICGLTISILFFCPAVNETDYEEILKIVRKKPPAEAGGREISISGTGAFQLPPG